MSQFHKSVLLKEVLEYLKPAPGKLFIDATAGGGGHTFELLALGAKVLAIDRDQEAIEHIKSEVRSRKSEVKIGEDLILACSNFNKISEIAKRNGFKKVDGILFDLGVSSHQLDEARRGFSFSREGPLDMRSDPNLKISAKDIINNFDKRRLHEIFEKYGQERLSWPVADAIYSSRRLKQIETTGQLAQIIERVYSKRGVRTKFRGPHAKHGVININPATKVFQALRIVVNSELLNLEETLPQTIDLLKVEGRLVLISFHSLEDAKVKRFFKRQRQLKVLTKRPIGPSEEEKLENPRSRSAKLRVAEKI